MTESKSVHFAACNHWSLPIGSPGCICVVVSKHELAALRVQLETIRKDTLEHCLVIAECWYEGGTANQVADEIRAALEIKTAAA